VAISPVDAVSEPVTDVLPVAFPMSTAPVPPVPIVVTPEPVVLMVVVPVIAAPPAVTVSPPAVAVTPPVVATRPVEAVRVPVTAVFPVEFPIFSAPVPPVAIVVMAEPLALIEAVPTWVSAPSVLVPVTPRVPLRVRFVEERVPMVVVPVTARLPSIVALSVTTKLVPAVNVLVDAIDPGAKNVAGIVQVSSPDPAVTVIWSAVPLSWMLLADGLTKVSLVSDNVLRELDEALLRFHTPAPVV